MAFPSVLISHPSLRDARGHPGRGVAIALTMCGCILFAACAPKAPESTPTEIRAVKTEVVKAEAATQQRTLSGVLIVAEETRLSFAVGGKLQSVPLREGDEFRAGQVIARLDPADFEREVAADKARLSSANSRLRETEATFRRYEPLARNGSVSQQEIARIEAAVAIARSDLQVAKVALATAEENLRRATLTAPRDGIVTKLVAKQFEEIAAGQPVYEVGTRDALEVLFLVPEHLVPNLRYDAQVGITIPGLGDRTVPGHIIEIGAGAEAGNAFRVRARLDEAPLGARSGMTASVALPVGSGENSVAAAFAVPLSALVFDTTETGPVVGSKAALFVFDATRGIVTRREVPVLGMAGDRVFVTGGLTDGERIVTAGVAFLHDGEEVRLWTPPE